MKRLFALLWTAVFAFTLTACGGGGDSADVPTKGGEGSGDGGTWSLYWYLCGSDLESNYGCATDDLIEMMDVDLPEGVQVVIQTGGATTWQNEIISPDALQRYVYDSEGMRLVDEVPSASMGDPDTLADFLDFATENYPADQRMLTFWNHGGGSVSGVSFDEIYDMDSITLTDLEQAFSQSLADDRLDIIGFDTCLMATIDTAAVCDDYASYMVASEELEPGNGWYYTGIMQTLAEQPRMNPLSLSEAICDTYVDGCELVGTEESITLSVTDLSKMPALLDAYDAYGQESLLTAVANPAFLASFAKMAKSSENYGGNTREQGYTNMADLGHLASNTADLLPDSSNDLISAIEDAVVYQVLGKYRPDSMGLAGFYSYDGDFDHFLSYADVGASDAVKYFYAYALTGDLPSDGYRYLESLNYTEDLGEVLTVDSMAWEDQPLEIDENAQATLTLGAEAYDVLSSVGFDLYYIDEEEDIILSLGTDNDMEADWDAGIFRDNFRGVWGSLDGYLCYMELAFEGENYNTYTVPILLNDEEYNLMVTYDFDIEDYIIEGARKSMDESGATDKNLRFLKVGDVIQTIHYASSLSADDEDFWAVPIDTLTVTEDTSFAETDLGDGSFMMFFTMTDMQGNTAYSAPAFFDVEDGEIYTSLS